MFYIPLNIESGEVITIQIKEDLEVEEKFITFNTKVNNKKVKILYYIKDLAKEKELKYGGIYDVKVDNITLIEDVYNNKSSFNYKKYEKSKKINYTLEVSNPNKVDQNNSVINKLKNFRESLIIKVQQAYPKQSLYINSLVLGKSIEDEKLKEDISNVGIVQLFTISGMHIVFIISILEFLLSYLKLSQKSITKLLLFILPVYGILAGGGISIKRVIEVYYLQAYYILKDENFNKLSLILTVLIFNLIINPYNLANIGFILSYGISIFLLLNKELFLYKKNKLKMKVMQNFQVIMFAFPLTNYLTNKFNILLPYTIILYNKLVEFMIILSFITLILLVFPFELMKVVILFIFNISIYLFKLLNYVDLLAVVSFKNLSVLYIVIFYTTYLRQIKEYYYYKANKLVKFYLLLLFLIFLNLPINIIGKLQIIDVGQGDSILIQYPLSSKTILIDTGPIDAKDELIDYLNAKGIKKIDYFVLTHNHADHVANALDIIKEFKVKNIIVGSNFKNLKELEKTNKELLKNINLIEVSGLTKTNIGYFYESNIKYEEENNNSIAYYTKLGNIDYLFMGDMEKEIEEELISKYNLDFIDKIKIGHHGSKTSTTQQFLESTTPEEVFISSGKNNMYGHPSQETIKKLEQNNIKYKNTQTEGEIVKYFLFAKY